jgi:hypothetical protein
MGMLEELGFEAMGNARRGSGAGYPIRDWRRLVDGSGVRGEAAMATFGEFSPVVRQVRMTAFGSSHAAQAEGPLWGYS